jgi:Asp-tRNA(Asn)/Glu-tRNA(Gln) amidotransferase A subunit family amidase
MSIELNKITASDIAHQIRQGTDVSGGVARACLDRIAEREASVNAWAFVAGEQPDGANGQSRCGALYGVPVGVKDVIDTADQPTRYNSAIYASHRPAADAASVALLKRAGARILGKTVTTEFANIHPAATRNPHNLAHSPGGSSSGSAAAVADFMVPVALGTQTAGSVIRPAAYCGVFAIKPTFGSINRAGMKSLAESLDTIGIFSRAPKDLALVLGVLSGRQTTHLVPGFKPRIGLCRTPQWDRADEVTRVNIEQAAEKLARAGAVVSEFEMPKGAEDLCDRHKSIMGFESARALAWELDNAPHLLSEALRHRLEDGWRVTRDEYDSVRLASAECRRSLADRFTRFDFLLTPSAPGEAPLASAGTGDSLFNRVWTLLGVPCVNVPFGKGAASLPLGLQLVGSHDDDMRLIACADWVNAALHG